MGGQESKITDPKANVVNEVVITHNNSDLLLIEICLLIITTIVCIDVLVKIYSQHNKILKKKYQSRETDLDKM